MAEMSPRASRAERDIDGICEENGTNYRIDHWARTTRRDQRNVKIIVIYL